MPQKELSELEKWARQIAKLNADGQAVVAHGTFSGRLSLRTDRRMAAMLTFDDARDIMVDTLPPASTLPVIPICDLFQDLGAWKGQRIAVQAEFVGTMEGAWLSGHCESGFVTDGHRWPVLLTWGAPDYFSADPPSLFRIDESRTRLPPDVSAQLKDHHNVTATATFVGRLRMRDQYIGRCRSGGDYIGNGFGHLGGAAAELIIESVRGAVIAPRMRQTDDETPRPANHRTMRHYARFRQHFVTPL